MFSHAASDSTAKTGASAEDASGKQQPELVRGSSVDDPHQQPGFAAGDDDHAHGVDPSDIERPASNDESGVGQHLHAQEGRNACIALALRSHADGPAQTVCPGMQDAGKESLIAGAFATESSAG
jgi:hypothetical protein